MTQEEMIQLLRDKCRYLKWTVSSLTQYQTELSGFRVYLKENSCLITEEGARRLDITTPDVNALFKEVEQLVRAQIQENESSLLQQFGDAVSQVSDKSA